MTTAVNQREALESLHLLRRAIPGAVVTGRQEVGRVGGLVFTLTLARTIREDTYDGVVVTVLNPEVGKLDAAHITFAEHGAAVDDRELTRYNAHGAVPRLAADVQELENAVRNYVQVFAG